MFNLTYRFTTDKGNMSQSSMSKKLSKSHICLLIVMFNLIYILLISRYSVNIVSKILTSNHRLAVTLGRSRSHHWDYDDYVLLIFDVFAIVGHHNKGNNLLIYIETSLHCASLQAIITILLLYIQWCFKYRRKQYNNCWKMTEVAHGIVDNLRILQRDDTFQPELAAAGVKLVVVDFFATW